MPDADLERRLEPLYREPPEEFVAARDALVGDLRASGDREAAARVKKLRRPSQAAWLINRVAIDEPDRAQAVAEAADNLAAVQRRVLDEGGGADELRAAADGERRRIGELVTEARRVAASHPRPVSETVIERVAETLQAVGSDHELRDQLLRGRIERDHRAATIGLPADAGTATRRRRARRRAEPREVKRAREQLARLRDSLAAAEQRRDADRRAVEEAETETRRLRVELGKSEAKARDLARKVDDAERRLKG